MQILVHDLPAQEFDLPGTHIISNNGAIKPCISCFGCWVKTPGKCVIDDIYSDTGVLLSRCSDLAFVSECAYGGFSPFVKNVLDRAISYISPHFVIRSNEMHHKRRYANVIRISAYFYGTDITEQEKRTAVSLVQANAVNFDGKVGGVFFCRSAAEAKEALACASH